jgi:hypothetical protein
MACAVQIHSWPQRVSANYLALAVLVAPLSVLETATLDKKTLPHRHTGTYRYHTVPVRSKARSVAPKIADADKFLSE